MLRKYWIILYFTDTLNEISVIYLLRVGITDFLHIIYRYVLKDRQYYVR